MKPSQLSKLLSETIKAGLPVLITGAPGIGKSDIVAKAAADAGADMILSHPVVADPTDAKGLPWVSKDSESATFLPFGDLDRAIKADKLTVWFLDDLGQASQAVQASFMQLLLAREVNGHRISDHVVFVAATNRRTDRAGVSGILEPVKSRFATIVELEPDLDDWCNWAFANDISPKLIAFLRFKANLLCDFQPEADLTQSPVPRTWSHVSKLLTLSLDETTLRTSIAGAVGEGAATEFVAFMELYKNLPSIDAILMDPEGSDIPTEPATLYAVTAGLAQKANPENFGRIAKYAERLMDSNHGEFAALLVRDSHRRNSAVQSTDSFIKLSSGPIGDLMRGV